MGIQAVVGVAVVGRAVADLHTVAVAVHGGGRAHDAISNGVDRRAARRGKVGAPVGDAPGVGLAKLGGDAPVAVQRAAEGKAGQVQGGGVLAALGAGVGVQIRRGLQIGFAGGLGHHSLCLFGGLLLGQGGVGGL